MDIQMCEICGKLNPIMPYKLLCGHLFCFLCIKMHVVSNSKYCPECNEYFDENLNDICISDICGIADSWKNIKSFWMYSSRYGDSW